MREGVDESYRVYGYDTCQPACASAGNGPGRTSLAAGVGGADGIGTEDIRVEGSRRLLPAINRHHLAC
jgi:hypothetical protein